jgi:hypothetical protein
MGPGVGAPGASGMFDERGGETTRAFRIELPNGEVFHQSMLASTSNVLLMNRSLATGGSYIPVVTNNGTSFGAAMVDARGKLSGAAQVLHASGAVKMILVFENDVRNGPMTIYNNVGQWLVFGQYNKGSLDGFVCLFRNNQPWLLRKHEKGGRDAVGSWLIVNGNAQARPPDDPELKQADETLDKLIFEASRDATELKNGIERLRRFRRR